MKIRTKSGEIIDLVQLRSQWERNLKMDVYMCGFTVLSRSLQILDALEAALNILKEENDCCLCRDYRVEETRVGAHNNAIHRVHEAAGVIDSDSESNALSNLIKSDEVIED